MRKSWGAAENDFKRRATEPSGCCGEGRFRLIHVFPLDDLIDHVTDDPESCLCGPTVSEGVVKHHSLDGREFSEPDYQGPSMPIES